MAFKKILVTGADGMLGQDLVPYLRAKGYDVLGTTVSTLDLLKPVEVIRQTIADFEPEIIVHAAAYTNVDGAEREPELALAINKDGTAKMAAIARELGCILAYISTDFVFDGTKGTPYTSEDKVNPLSTYGRSKYYGELVIQEQLEMYYILRTSWLYGVHGNNFVQFVLDGAKQGRELSIVDDWFGSPTWTGSLCHLIESIVTSGAFGVYHTADSGAVSKYQQAVAVCKAAGLSSAKIKPVSYKSLSFAAQRPAYSVLDCGQLAVPHWQTALQGYLAQMMPPPALQDFSKDFA